MKFAVFLISFVVVDGSKAFFFNLVTCHRPDRGREFVEMGHSRRSYQLQ